MKVSWLAVGAVFRWSADDDPRPQSVLRWSDDGPETPQRVLLHDADMVMYDAWRSHLRNWGMADLQKVRRQRFNYYVVDVSTVMEKATYLRTEPLTHDEAAIHRPDLPYAVAQCAAIQWPDSVPDAAAQLAERLRSAGCLDAGDVAALNAPEIYLYPFGPQGGHKPGVRVKADDGTAFTTAELIWKAANIQAPHIRDVMPVQGGRRLPIRATARDPRVLPVGQREQVPHLHRSVEGG